MESNQDKTVEELKAEEESAAAVAPPDDSQAKSLVCQECGKKFRGTAEAEYHASKTYGSLFVPQKIRMLIRLLPQANIPTLNNP